MKQSKIRDIKTLFGQEGDYYRPVRVGNFTNNNNIGYESNDDRNKTLSIREYLDVINTYLKDIIIFKSWKHGKLK